VRHARRINALGVHFGECSAPFVAHVKRRRYSGRRDSHFTPGISLKRRKNDPCFTFYPSEKTGFPPLFEGFARFDESSESSLRFVLEPCLLAAPVAALDGWLLAKWPRCAHADAKGGKQFVRQRARLVLVHFAALALDATSKNCQRGSFNVKCVLHSFSNAICTTGRWRVLG